MPLKKINKQVHTCTFNVLSLTIFIKNCFVFCFSILVSEKKNIKKLKNRNLVFDKFINDENLTLKKYFHILFLKLFRKLTVFLEIKKNYKVHLKKKINLYTGQYKCFFFILDHPMTLIYVVTDL